ncbi:MAG: hypothetical protein WBF32_14095 [Candidatus Aminicenantaceae bacterium]
MKPNLQYCAQHYLRQWMTEERPLHEALNSEDRETILQGLSDAVRFFKVARNLPKKYDVGRGLRRYEPLLNIFQTFTTGRSPSSADFADHVDQFQRKLSSLYGRRDLISIASKLLWLRYRDPFIIYDSRVRSAIGVSPGDYPEFVMAWLSHFQHLESEIAVVRRSLPNLLPYFLADTADTEQVVHAACSESWFHQRVFDIYLWHIGGGADNNSLEATGDAARFAYKVV